MISEIVGIAKHIDRLVKNGEPFENYFEEFLHHFKLKRENIDYRGEPAIAET